MVDVRVSAASGSSADWAASTLVLGVGQFAWETDTLILRVGDGETLEPNLPIVAQGAVPAVEIDDADADVSGASVWSSLKTQSEINEALVTANSYTDQALQGGARIDVAFQNGDGTWPNRPVARVVFAFTTNGSTAAPVWLQPGLDVIFYRS